jgi:hypothetical protein
LPIAPADGLEIFGVLFGFGLFALAPDVTWGLAPDIFMLTFLLHLSNNQNSFFIPMNLSDDLRETLGGRIIIATG